MFTLTFNNITKNNKNKFDNGDYARSNANQDFLVVFQMPKRRLLPATNSNCYKFIVSIAQ